MLRHQMAYLSVAAAGAQSAGLIGEAQVESWRRRSKLPFPTFDDEDREQREEILA